MRRTDSKRLSGIVVCGAALVAAAILWPGTTTHAAPIGMAPAITQADAKELYLDKCGQCHGENRQGNPPAFPGIVGVGKKYSDAELTGQIRHGKGRMPAFPSLSDDEVAGLVAFLKTDPPAGASTGSDAH